MRVGTASQTSDRDKNRDNIERVKMLPGSSGDRICSLAGFSSLLAEWQHERCIEGGKCRDSLEVTRDCTVLQ